MGEDGISFHELPAPKTLRFSTDEANPSDILPTTTAPVSASSQNVSSSIVVKEVIDKTCVPMSGGKYADFLKVSFTCLCVFFRIYLHHFTC